MSATGARVQDLLWNVDEGLFFDYDFVCGKPSGVLSLAATERLFEKTVQLWEKTDVTTWEAAGGEYDAAPMIGWSAGVYLALLDFLHNHTADTRSRS